MKYYKIVVNDKIRMYKKSIKNDEIYCQIM